jgi:single-stranded-DNA-specific exonuclease
VTPEQFLERIARERVRPEQPENCGLGKRNSPYQREAEPHTVKEFLHPVPRFGNPLARIPECQHACERLLAACKRHEPVMIYGDFDCDGVVSVTQMHDVLRALGLGRSKITCVIPDRLQDGYNLKWNVVNRHRRRIKAEAARPKLIVAVDCGSTANEEARQIIGAGMDLIIVDHHEPSNTESWAKDLSKVIHLNPKLWRNRPGQDAGVEMENMCAGGLTYLLARALADTAPHSEKWQRSRALLLAGLATCADVVKLTGINRIFLKHSLRLANVPSRLAKVPGLALLKERLGPQATTGWRITEETYGFYWGPAINAAGRMQQADAALNMMLATDIEDAKPWVAECLQFNRLRKATERCMVHEAEMMIEEQIMGTPPGEIMLARKTLHPGKSIAPEALNWDINIDDPMKAKTCELLKLPPVLTLSHPCWHPGVVGIVAARIKDRHGRPVIVSSLHPGSSVTSAVGNHEFGPAKWKGSGRSIMHCNLGVAFHTAAKEKFIQGGGGHPMAGGLEFTDKQRGRLHKRLAHLLGLTPERQRELSTPIIELALPASSFTPEEWAGIFAKLRPFGNGNPYPPLIIEAAELISVHALTRSKTDPYDRVDKNESNGTESKSEAEPADESSNEVDDAQNYWEFKFADVLDGQVFITRLHEQADPVAAWLARMFDKKTVNAIKCFDAKNEDARPLLKCVLKNLNQIMAKVSLFDVECFTDIKLRKQTRHLLEQNLSGPLVIQANRLCLEDAFPGELRKLRGWRFPETWAYEGHFVDKITGKHFRAQWVEIEQAEILWRTHLFLEEQAGNHFPVHLPTFFRLQLILRASVSPGQQSEIYRGKLFKWQHRFEVRQCIPIKREEKIQALLRMPVVKS